MAGLRKPTMKIIPYLPRRCHESRGKIPWGRSCEKRYCSAERANGGKSCKFGARHSAQGSGGAARAEWPAGAGGDLWRDLMLLLRFSVLCGKQKQGIQHDKHGTGIMYQRADNRVKNPGGGKNCRRRIQGTAD